MNKEALKKAKQQLHNQYGEALAKKASDAFCLLAAAPVAAATRSVGFENVAPSSETVPSGVIIEYKEDEAPQPKSLTTTANNRLAQLLEEVQKEEGLEAQLYEAMRQSGIKVYREKIIQILHPTNAFLERSIERTFAHGSGSLQQQPYLTEVCWLNQTVRTIAGPKSLAEVAADPQITRLDLPRRLEAEIRDTGKLLFAPQYRLKFSRKGKGVIVAVIDSEVASNHKAFGKRIVHRSNFTKEPWGNPHKHATGVAGIIGSADEVFAGMAPAVTLYNYKVLATEPSLNADDFGGARAIQKALEDGVQIANCSWGAGPAGDGTGREARACNTAWNLGLTLVKSAGNKGPGANTLTTPADAKGVIVVGATGKNGKKVEDYSSRGVLPSGERRPHLVAPGGTLNGDGIMSCLLAGGFDDIGAGTSFATPHVTGLLALIVEEKPSLSPDEQRNLVIKLSKKLSGTAAGAQGAGLPSLASLLK